MDQAAVVVHQKNQAVTTIMIMKRVFFLLHD